MYRRPFRHACVALALPLSLPLSLLAVAACDSGSSDTTGGTGKGDSGGGNSGDSDPGVSNDDSATEGSATAGPSEGSGESADDATGAPLEEGRCRDNSDCDSGHCYNPPIWNNIRPGDPGICGDCGSDSDCEAGSGCDLPNPLANPPQGASCGDGTLGSGCETSDACQEGFQCAFIFGAPGIIEITSCSECLTDGDCSDGFLCSPTLDVAEFRGFNTCVAPGSVTNGQGCNYGDGTTGNEACESGICAGVEVSAGLPPAGICGECQVSADCPDGLECAPTHYAAGEIVPATCVEPG